MKKQILLLTLSAILMLITLSCDLSPTYAANKACDCLQESAHLWKQDEKLNAFTKFTEYEQLLEDYKKKFSSSNLSKLNEEYDKC